MRLRERDLKNIYIRTRIPLKDNEGDVYESWGDPVRIRGTIQPYIQPFSGQVVSEAYGEKMSYMLTIRVNDQGGYVDQIGKVSDLGGIHEKDGVCVYVDKNTDPDYEIMSVKGWDVPIMELRKRGV
jgi:hypothetical protein